MNSKIRMSQLFKNTGWGKGDLFQAEEAKSPKRLKQGELGKLKENKSVCLERKKEKEEKVMR